MKKSFSKEEILMKHETNIKSATSAFGLAGLLGIIYIVRFFIKKNFEFYFSLTFTEFILRLSQEGKIPTVLSISLLVLYIALYLTALILAAKKSEKLRLCLGVYLADTLFFVPLFMLHGNIQPEFFIDIIVHVFVIVFLAAGIKSNYAMKKQ